MKDRKHVAWLYEQLPTLVSEGVLAPEAAVRLHRRYGVVDTHVGRRWAMTLFSILGAMLIGSGLILLLAYNWEGLSRPMRALIALAPLLIAQMLAAWVLWSKTESAAWREGVGTFLTLAIGISIALISQTYHLGGDLDDFLLTWGVLGLPVAYLLRATVPALLYIIDITFWTSVVMQEGWQALGYWPLLIALLPYVWSVTRSNRYQACSVLLCWLLALTWPFALGMSLHRVIDTPASWLLLYSAVAGVLYMTGARFWGEATTTWQRPWQTLGALGVVVLALVFSFEEVWMQEMRLSYWRDTSGVSWQTLVACGLALLWPGAAVLLWLDSVLQRRLPLILPGAMPVVAITAYTVVHHTELGLLGMLLFNAYLLILGVSVLLMGLRTRRLATINAGILILAAVIVSRFFDADIGFVLRGVVFIILGIGFLVTNLVLMRRQGAQQ